MANDKNKKDKNEEEKRESGLPGGGQGRKDEVGKSGVYPVSSMQGADADAQVQPEQSWGQGERGAAGYNDSGRSEIYYVNNPNAQQSQGSQTGSSRASGSQSSGGQGQNQNVSQAMNQAGQQAKQQASGQSNQSGGMNAAQRSDATMNKRANEILNESGNAQQMNQKLDQQRNQGMNQSGSEQTSPDINAMLQNADKQMNLPNYESSGQVLNQQEKAANERIEQRLQRGENMTTREIPRNQWTQFFDDFSKSHEGWMTTMEVDDPSTTAGKRTEAENLPLRGITADMKGQNDNIISVIMGHLPDEPDHVTRFINAPTKVTLNEDQAGDRGYFEIDSQNEGKTFIHFQPAGQPAQRLRGEVY